MLPRSVVSEDVHVETAVFHNITDIFHNPNPIANGRRGRIEWPTLNRPLMSLFRGNRSPSATDPLAYSRAEAVIRAEMAKSNTRKPSISEIGIQHELLQSRRRPDIGSLIKVLYFRARVQSAIWDLFELLHSKSIVNLESLKVPLNLEGGFSREAYSLAALLCCFKGPLQMHELISECPRHMRFLSPFIAPLHWLTTMIVRSSADDRLVDVLEAIHESGFLGDVDGRALYEFVEEIEEVEYLREPREAMASAETAQAQQNVWGFWLPHGIGPRDNRDGSPEDLAKEIQKQIGVFNEIEEAYKAFFNISDEILLERHQASCQRSTAE
ncbi:MAG: hypothetical protein M1819_004230 [Sarea resinae]|nr:MAG: hypothetical protein M1819_004230 [Sarea resinae]